MCVYVYIKIYIKKSILLNTYGCKQKSFRSVGDLFIWFVSSSTRFFVVVFTSERSTFISCSSVCPVHLAKSCIETLQRIFFNTYGCHAIKKGFFFLHLSELSSTLIKALRTKDTSFLTHSERIFASKLVLKCQKIDPFQHLLLQTKELSTQSFSCSSGFASSYARFFVRSFSPMAAL